MGGGKSMLIIVSYSIALCIVAIVIDKMRGLSFSWINKIFKRRTETL